MAREQVLVDTSVLIDHLRKTRKNQTLFYRLSLRCDSLISAIPAFEFSVAASPNNYSISNNCWQIFQCWPLIQAAYRWQPNLSGTQTQESDDRAT